MWIRRIEPLREANKDGSEGGGDGPKFLTEEAFGELFNRAFTAKWRDLEKKTEQRQVERDEAFMSKLSTSLDEKLAALAPEKKDAGKADDKGGKGAVLDDTVKRQLEAMAAQLDAEKKAREAAETRAKDVEGQRRFDTARDQLRGLLKDKAHPDYLEDWIDRLTVVQKRLTVGEDGNVSLRVKHTPYKGAPETDEELPLDQAVAALLQRPEEKRFQGVPTRTDDKGSRGPSQGGQGTPNIKSDNPMERVAARLREKGLSFDEEFGGGLG